MKYTLKAVMTLSVAALSFLAAYADAPVGMAAHVTGKPDFAHQKKWKPLHVLQRFEADDEVRCGAGESVIVVLFDGGGRYVVGAGATGKVGANGVAGARPMGAASGASAAIGQRLSGARNGAVMARPASEAQRLHAPATDAIAPLKSPPSHDWLRADERSFSPNPVKNAESYVFTLFDLKDYIVFTQKITPAVGAAVQVDIPADVKLVSKRPYVWRLHGFKNGKLVEGHWGVTTMLSAEDEAQLLESEKALLTADGKLPDDPTDLAVLAELYRNYGALQGALEVLGNAALVDQPGIEDTKDEVYAQAGIYASALADQVRKANAAAAAGEQ